MVELLKKIKNNSIDMVITDLDGTLLNPSQKVSHRDYQTLELLGRYKIHRVIATGRSYFSALKVLPPNFPIDYLIFSTGAGIQKWDSKQNIYTRYLQSDEVASISRLLIDHQIDFMILDPVPASHRFCYFRTKRKNPDFDTRLLLYKPHIYSMDVINDGYRPACQILAIIPEGFRKYNEIKNMLVDYKVIRTTSPLDGETTWVEIFPRDVSKGHAADWLCQYLSCPVNSVIAIGNDYNDLDLLNWANHSFVVANAPPDLKEKYFVTDKNTKDGFSKAIMNKWVSI